MPNVMHHPHQQHHHMSWYFLVAIAVMFVLILTLSIIPTVSIPAPTTSLAAIRENAHQLYLYGEKVMYTNPIVLNNALVQYHAGEKILYDINDATWAYHLGEKSATLNLNALNAEDALYIQRMGEKILE